MHKNGVSHLTAGSDLEGATHILRWLSFIPEVKGLSLEEVDELYRSGIKPWNSSSFVPEDKHLVHHEKVVINEDVREDKGKSGL